MALNGAEEPSGSLTSASLGSCNQLAPRSELIIEGSLLPLRGVDEAGYYDAFLARMHRRANGEQKTMSERETCAARQHTWSTKLGRTRCLFLTAAAVLAISALLVWAVLDLRPSASIRSITVWQSPTHACCTKWVSYMRAKGYRAEVNYVDEMVTVKTELGILDATRSCHTAKIGEYVIEGHVPAAAIARLLDERPMLKGIALPSMPAGPPGMGGTPGVYRVVGFTAEGHISRFADVGI